jgi:low affinity Fe/Cu permease
LSLSILDTFGRAEAGQRCAEEIDGDEARRSLPVIKGKVIEVSTDGPEAETQSPAPLFDRFASQAARWTGHALSFSASLAVTVAWAASGPLFHFSDTWQLVINTGTTVLTFLMVFIIQNTINRDAAAMHLKLDELLRVTSEARDNLMGTETLGEAQIKQLHAEEV